MLSLPLHGNKYNVFYFVLTDPYIKLELTQPSRADQKHQTRVKKKTTHPCYNEEFMFHISPKIDDLTHTSLTLTMYDHEAIRSDEVIGQVGHLTVSSHCLFRSLLIHI